MIGLGSEDRVVSNSSTIQERNRQLADAINQEALANPNSPYAGKFVGIANGQVVVVTDDLDELVHKLDEVEPDREKTFCIEAGIDYDEPQYIWSFV
jgi:hypothetical protein